MPEEQRQQKKFQEEATPQAQGWAISGDPLGAPLPSVTDGAALPDPAEEVVDARQLEYRTPDAEDPDIAAPAPLFGYIGVGIAMVAMLLGVAGMIIGVVWFIGWLNA